MCRCWYENVINVFLTTDNGAIPAETQKIDFNTAYSEIIKKLRAINTVAQGREEIYKLGDVLEGIPNLEPPKTVK